MPKKLFASYEKTSVVKIEKITHTIRLRLNMTRNDVMGILNNVPKDAIVTMIVGDDTFDGYGEIIFEETKGDETCTTQKVT